MNLTISQAVSDRASDIHVEPTEHDLRIRYRVDGVLHEVMHAPKQIQAGVISRLKVMAEINIAERRVPQDGRISVKVNGKSVDLRVATLPTVYGEKVVMRILDKGQALLTLDDQGFLPDVLDALRGVVPQAVRHDHGDRTDRVGEVDDALRDAEPAQQRRPQHHHGRGPGRVPAPRASTRSRSTRKAGLSFAAALRSILRADPDIVLVGEIRDKETATIAIEAALTGHLVLTTLHTNDAASTPLRLVEMGVEPFLVTSALDCVLAQRLARRLCPKCAEPYQPSEAELVAGGLADGLHARVADAPPGGRLLPLRTNRIQGEIRPARGALGHRGDRTAHHRAQIDRRREEDGGHAGDGPAARRRVPQGRRRMTSLEEVFRVVA